MAEESDGGVTVASEINRLRKAFPSFRKWFAELGPEGQEDCRTAWLEQLDGCTPLDVAAVVSRLIRGSYEMPPNYNFDRLALVIAEHCQAIKLRRSEQDRVAEMRAPKSRLSPEAEEALARFRRSTKTPKPLRNRRDELDRQAREGKR